jgi:hypothetical protein
MRLPPGVSGSNPCGDQLPARVEIETLVNDDLRDRLRLARPMLRSVSNRWAAA